MLNKNNKTMFFILLTPLYLLLFISLIGMSAGSIDWIYFTYIAIVILLAAWGLSREKSIIVNITGLLLLLGLGTSIIYPTLNRTERIGPWTINLYVGATLMLWGLIAFIYDVTKFVLKRDNE